MVVRYSVPSRVPNESGSSLDWDLLFKPGGLPGTVTDNLEYGGRGSLENLNGGPLKTSELPPGLNGPWDGWHQQQLEVGPGYEQGE
jgi:hypothetical protein